jgi:hypothetical protein
MKITAYVPLLLFTPLLSTAQLSKGQWMVGGSADFNHTTTNNKTINFDQHIEQTGYNLFPGAGYFFMDRFVAGLRTNLSNSKTEDKIDGTYYRTSDITTAPGAGIGAFARYYVFKPKNKFNAFAEAAYSYNSVKETSDWRQGGIGYNGTPTSNVYITESKYKVNYYSLTAGPVIFISSKVSFELSVGYTLGKVTNQDQTIDRIALGTGFQVFLGK